MVVVLSKGDILMTHSQIPVYGSSGCSPGWPGASKHAAPTNNRHKSTPLQIFGSIHKEEMKRIMCATYL